MTYPNFEDQKKSWTESEKCLLGSLLLNPKAVYEVRGIVSHTDFFDTSLGRLFGLLCAMRDAGEPTSSDVLTPKLKQIGLWSEIGEAAGLAKLANCVPNAAHAEFYATGVANWSSIRETRKALQRSLRLAEQAMDPAPCLEEITSQLESTFTNRRAPQGIKTITARQAMQAARDVAASALKTGKPSGTLSGFESIDSYCGGFMRGELTTLAASTGFGKTAFALETIVRIAENGMQPLMFSFEMGDTQVGQRYLARLTQVPVSIMRSGSDLRESDIPKFDQAISSKTMERIDLVVGSTFKIHQVCNFVKSYVTGKRLDLLVLDYIGKTRHSRAGLSQTEHVSEVVGALKELALELNIPILALAQLNRQAEQQQPGLSNLADSASVERDSDAVWLLYGKRGESELTLEIAKGRQCRTGAIKLNFQSAQMRWTEVGGR